MLRVASVMGCKFVLPLALLLMSSSAFAADAIEEKAKICTACHGETGVPQLKTTPVIRGQNAGYLFFQLRDFKSGARKNDLMSPIAASLQQEDLLPLAEYFSKLKWPNLQQTPAPADVATKAQAAISSVGCIACHLDHFQGDGTTARLAGQQHDYLLKTMTDFRDGMRGNNPGMSGLMKATSPDSITALAEYLAGMQIDQYLGGQGH
ncbi:MAG TPA: cytochrome c4 [Methyloceanibacter sp.]|jgi:cytochrome c553|nr:cytochrome c4 [Methyloceanibacter sp.]